MVDVRQKNCIGEKIMVTVNYMSQGEGTAGVNYPIGALSADAIAGQETYVDRVAGMLVNGCDFAMLNSMVKKVGVTKRFIDVIDTFKTPENETPAGFRVECVAGKDGLLEVDLVRDISYDKNGVRRPTGVPFSADSANPYEVEPISGMLANLTCNPGIVYDLFINNPAANVGNKYKTREEVMEEIGRILGPGCDISVELNNPFEQDFNKILDECYQFQEMLTEYRLVVKVPHTGPVDDKNVAQLLEGDKRFETRHSDASTARALAGHSLALKLREKGFRINFTLMFEPYQTSLAMQAKPYFINSFIRHRGSQTTEFARLISSYEMTGNVKFIEDLRNFMLVNDYLSSKETGCDLLKVYQMGKDILQYRNAGNAEGADGLDAVRHNLRLMKQSMLKDTRLIICSMEGDYNYPDIDKLVVDPEFADVIDRLVITAEPAYLARFTSANQVVSYQRRFMNAVNNDQKK